MDINNAVLALVAMAIGKSYFLLLNKVIPPAVQ